MLEVNFEIRFIIFNKSKIKNVFYFYWDVNLRQCDWGLMVVD